MRLRPCVILAAALAGGLLLSIPAAAQSSRDLADPGPVWAGITDTTSLGERIDAHVTEAERLLDAVRDVAGPRSAENTMLPFKRAEFELSTARQLTQIALNAHPDSAFRQDAAGDAAGDTVFVTPPTGEPETDRASVQSAFDAVQPGGTVRFAPGTYRLGTGARLTVPDVTVLGHSDGTTLRGCDPEAFDLPENEVERVVFGCTGLYLQAERQTVRGLTFEYTWHGIVIGPFPTTAEEAAALGPDGPAPYPSGGHRVEGNTFRATPNGLRVLGTGDGVSVVRDNDFIDVFHAIGIYGAPLHFVGNRITVEDPERVPFSRHPGSAILVGPGHTDCAGHVVAENLVEGYPDPVYVYAETGETCRGVEVRENTIRAGRVRIPHAWAGYKPTEEDSTMVGVPITLRGAAPGEDESEAAPAGLLEEIVVRGNRIEGAEGLGILVRGATRSRIEGNTLTGIRRRSPFPGITWDGADPTWEGANGSGIWLSPGSRSNEIAGNTFEDVAGAAVVVQGDSNRVALDDPAHVVRDLGVGNRVDRFAVRAAPTEGGRHHERLVAVVRTSSLLADGEQTYITLFEGGTASGLVVVNAEGGRLFGTTVPDTWEWLDGDTIEICGRVTILRNEVGFPPMERECAPHTITGKELDLDEDGEIDLVETFTILSPGFYRERPGGGQGR